MRLAWDRPGIGSGVYRIFTASGRFVIELPGCSHAYSGPGGAGTCATSWNGRDAEDRIQPSGLYWARYFPDVGDAGGRTTNILLIR